MSIVVETRKLVKTYMQGSVPVRALRGLDLQIAKGELVSILGPSGSGKSTLLNMIGALDTPTDGEVIIDGVPTSTLNQDKIAELRQEIGFVFQYFNLIPRLNAFRNVELPMTIKGKLSKAERKEQVEKIMGMVGLSDRMLHKPTELSGGQQQRVAIARALAQNPKFLLMDEPTGNVDTKNRDAILALVQKLNQEQGITVIIVTHDLEIAKRTRRTIHLVDGMIESDEMNEPLESNVEIETENSAESEQ